MAFSALQAHPGNVHPEQKQDIQVSELDPNLSFLRAFRAVWAQRAGLLPRDVEEVILRCLRR